MSHKNSYLFAYIYSSLFLFIIQKQQREKGKNCFHLNRRMYYRVNLLISNSRFILCDIKASFLFYVILIWRMPYICSGELLTHISLYIHIYTVHLDSYTLLETMYNVYVRIIWLRQMYASLSHTVNTEAHCSCASAYCISSFNVETSRVLSIQIPLYSFRRDSPSRLESRPFSPIRLLTKINSLWSIIKIHC